MKTGFPATPGKSRRRMRLFLLLSLAWPTVQAELLGQSAALNERIWYDGSQPRKVWMAADEMAVIFEGNGARQAQIQSRFEQSAPDAQLLKQDGPVAYYKLPKGAAAAREAAEARTASGVRHASPVFYENPGDPSSLLALSGEIIVGFPSAPTNQQLEEFARAHGVTLVQALTYSPHTFLLDARRVRDSLELANRIYKSGRVAFAFPNWIRSMARR